MLQSGAAAVAQDRLELMALVSASHVLGSRHVLPWMAGFLTFRSFQMEFESWRGGAAGSIPGTRGGKRALTSETSCVDTFRPIRRRVECMSSCYLLGHVGCVIFV